ncbi:MAG: rod shape-determining protein MreC [Saprospiraceae bacterium]|nr:rod shape-determining protein MreC [Saprospiraceae bacterium]
MRNFSIRSVADSLAKENADLKMQLEASKYIATYESGAVSFPLDTSTIRPDTAQKKDVIQKFSYVAASVINNSIARRENYMTLNRGKKHGIEPGMGVVSSNGVVGIVRNVTEHYAQVMSILNEQINVSAMIRRTRYFGSLKWSIDRPNPKYMRLESIPKHAELVVGDTVMTSGFSDIFPGELRIGRVENFKIENGSNFYTIDVALDNDIANIQYVYVVKSLMLEELKQVNRDPLPKKKKFGARRF